MGKPKFSKKKYETPNHPWKEARIKAENELVAKYGLKNKREIWKAETALRSYRGQARGLLARIDSDDPQTKKELHQLLSHLTRYNILPLNSTIDDVLALNTEDILKRRLQTLTYLKGFASTPKHARQLINHGHIAIDGRCVNVPGYRVTKNEEKDISFALDSPLNDQAHPARPSGDFVSKIPAGPGADVREQPLEKQTVEKPKGKPKPDITSEKKPDEKKPDEKKPDEKKPDEKKPDEKEPMKAGEDKAEKKPVEKKETPGEKASEKKSEKPDEKKTSPNEEPHEKKEQKASENTKEPSSKPSEKPKQEKPDKKISTEKKETEQ